MTDDLETPLAKKLGIQAGFRVTFLNAPAGFRESLGALPANVKIIGVQKPLDLIVFFPKSVEDLENKFLKLMDKLAPAGMFWVAWPKKSSGVETDLTFDAVQQTGLGLGMVDNKVCAISDVYSGLRFVIRVENRT
ncbi:MAG TPA: DUF3052 domain-containing protein [Blastocatellia bacterium]|nr:DUF3052 domain-containing protein [Blastocatellia bacterium]